MLDTGSEKPWHQTGHPVDIIGKEETEVAERFGGPCRGRTYGPLIKSGKRPLLTRFVVAMVSPLPQRIEALPAILLFLLCLIGFRIYEDF